MQELSQLVAAVGPNGYFAATKASRWACAATGQTPGYRTDSSLVGRLCIIPLQMNSDVSGRGSCSGQSSGTAAAHSRCRRPGQGSSTHQCRAVQGLGHLREVHLTPKNHLNIVGCVD